MCINSLLVTACPGRKDWDCACVGIDNDQCHQACLVNTPVTSTPFCHFAIPWGPILKSLSPHFSVHLHFLLLLLQRKNTPSLSFFLPYKNTSPLYTSSFPCAPSTAPYSWSCRTINLFSYKALCPNPRECSWVSFSQHLYTIVLFQTYPQYSFPMFWPPHTWQVKFSKTSLKGEGVD